MNRKKKLTAIAPLTTLIILAVVGAVLAVYYWTSSSQVDQTIHMVGTGSVAGQVILPDINELSNEKYTPSEVPELREYLSVTAGKEDMTICITLDNPEKLATYYEDYHMAFIVASSPSGSSLTPGDKVSEIWLDSPSDAIALDVAGTYTFDLTIDVTTKDLDVTETASASLTFQLG